MKSSHPQVLIVDSDPGDVRVLLEVLESAGISVHVRTNGRVALEAFHMIEPDLVVVDARMRGKTGVQVIEEIKRTDLGRATPVILMAQEQSGEETDVQALDAAGCSVLLQKPLTRQELLDALSRFLPGAFLAVPPAPGAPSAKAAPAAAATSGAKAAGPQSPPSFDEETLGALLDKVFPTSDSGDLAGAVAAKTRGASPLPRPSAPSTRPKPPALTPSATSKPASGSLPLESVSIESLDALLDQALPTGGAAPITAPSAAPSAPKQPAPQPTMSKAAPVSATAPTPREEPRSGAAPPAAKTTLPHPGPSTERKAEIAPDDLDFEPRQVGKPTAVPAAPTPPTAPAPKPQEQPARRQVATGPAGKRSIPLSPLPPEGGPSRAPDAPAASMRHATSAPPEAIRPGPSIPLAKGVPSPSPAKEGAPRAGAARSEGASIRSKRTAAPSELATIPLATVEPARSARQRVFEKGPATAAEAAPSSTDGLGRADEADRSDSHRASGRWKIPVLVSVVALAACAVIAFLAIRSGKFDLRPAAGGRGAASTAPDSQTAPREKPILPEWREGAAPKPQGPDRAPAPKESARSTPTDAPSEAQAPSKEAGRASGTPPPPPPPPSSGPVRPENRAAPAPARPATPTTTPPPTAVGSSAKKGSDTSGAAARKSPAGGATQPRASSTNDGRVGAADTKAEGPSPSGDATSSTEGFGSFPGVGEVVPFASPIPLHRVAPEYPRIAITMKQTGTVHLLVKVGTDGRVEEVKVTRSVTASLDKAAVAAAQAWTYKPAQQDGKAVATWVEEVVDFKLK